MCAGVAECEGLFPYRRLSFDRDRLLDADSERPRRR